MEGGNSLRMWDIRCLVDFLAVAAFVWIVHISVIHA